MLDYAVLRLPQGLGLLLLGLFRLGLLLLGGLLLLFRRWRQLRRRHPAKQHAGHKRGQDRSAKCGFSECGQGMHVAVYEIDDGDRKVLDGIEGVGNGYDVHEIT